MSFDHSIVLFLNGFAGQSAFLDSLIVFFAEYLPDVLIVLFFVFSFRRFTPFYGRLMLLIEGIGASLLARVFVEVFRLFIHRLRPLVADPNIHGFLIETSYSFPSGHAAFFFALSTVVYIYDNRWGVWFYAASLVIGLARVAAGAHYPTDILGGALLGVAVGWCVHRFFRRLRSQTSAQSIKETTPASQTRHPL